MIGGTAITRKQGSSSVNRISLLVSTLCRHQVFVLCPWAVYELSLMKALVYSTQKTRFYPLPARLVRHTHHIIFRIAAVAVPNELFAQIFQRIWTLAPAGG